jgi:hypothetical protein
MRVRHVSFLWLGFLRCAVLAQNSNGCEDKVFQYPNATASYNVIPFTPPGSSRGSNWTLGTAIVQKRLGTSFYDMAHTFWLDTSWTNNTSKFPSLEYNACASVLLAMSQNITNSNKNDPGDCSQVFDSNCRSALIDQARSNAIRYSNQAASNGACPFQLQSLPQACLAYRSNQGVVSSCELFLLQH